MMNRERWKTAIFGIVVFSVAVGGYFASQHQTAEDTARDTLQNSWKTNPIEPFKVYIGAPLSDSKLSEINGFLPRIGAATNAGFVQDCHGSQCRGVMRVSINPGDTDLSTPQARATAQMFPDLTYSASVYMALFHQVDAVVVKINDSQYWELDRPVLQSMYTVSLPEAIAAPQMWNDRVRPVIGTVTEKQWTVHSGTFTPGGSQ